MNYYTQLLLENIDNRADHLLKTGYENGWSIDRFIFEFGMLQRTAESIMETALDRNVFCYHGTIFIMDGDEDIPLHTIRNVSYFSSCITTIEEWYDYNDIPVGRHYSTAFGDIIVNTHIVKIS